MSPGDMSTTAGNWLALRSSSLNAPAAVAVREQQEVTFEGEQLAHAAHAHVSWKCRMHPHKALRRPCPCRRVAGHVVHVQTTNPLAVAGLFEVDS
jgi:hypothetical protein